MNDCKIHVLWKAKIHSSWGFHFAFSSITKLKRLNPVSCNKRNIKHDKSIFRTKSERHSCFVCSSYADLNPVEVWLLTLNYNAWHGAFFIQDWLTSSVSKILALFFAKGSMWLYGKIGYPAHRYVGFWDRDLQFPYMNTPFRFLFISVTELKFPISKEVERRTTKFIWPASETHKFSLKYCIAFCFPLI